MRPFPRLSPLLFGVLLVLPVRSPAADLEIVRVLTGWRDAASFHRISEYFTGKENTGGITVLRSHPDERAGFYWLVRLDNRGGPLAGARFELQVITPTAPEAKTFAFPADLRAGSALYQLGLTGADWPDAKARPAAWRLRVRAADGTALAVKDSFLWAQPGKP